MERYRDPTETPDRYAAVAAPNRCVTGGFADRGARLEAVSANLVQRWFAEDPGWGVGDLYFAVRERNEPDCRWGAKCSGER